MFQINDIVFTKIKIENVEENQSGVIVAVLEQEEEKFYLVEFLTKDCNYVIEHFHESFLSKELV